MLASERLASDDDDDKQVAYSSVRPLAAIAAMTRQANIRTPFRTFPSAGNCGEQSGYEYPRKENPTYTVQHLHSPTLRKILTVQAKAIYISQGAGPGRKRWTHGWTSKCTHVCSAMTMGAPLQPAARSTGCAHARWRLWPSPTGWCANVARSPSLLR
eukprot:COSAG06_NODE_2091_length_7610_cov_2.766343_5_plen_157_part_00